MFGLTARIGMRVAGASAIAVVGMVGAIYAATLPIEPLWFKITVVTTCLIVALIAILSVVLSTERGTNVEYVDGDRRVSITDAGVLALPIVRAALLSFPWRPAIPLQASGSIKVGVSPADEASIVPERLAIPASVEPLSIPPGAARIAPDPPKGPASPDAPASK